MEATMEKVSRRRKRGPGRPTIDPKNQRLNLRLTYEQRRHIEKQAIGGESLTDAAIRLLGFPPTTKKTA